MNELTPVEARRSMQTYLQAPQVLAHFRALLTGKGIDPEAFCAAVATDAMRQPKLALAISQAPDTLMDALTVCAASGLLPGSAHGQFYLIPRWASKRSRTEITFITGYKGLCDIAYRHPRVFSVRSTVAFKGEEFSYDPGENRVTHKWNPEVPREALDHIHAVYAQVELSTPAGQHAGGQPILKVMTQKEILAAKARSETGKRGYGPWIDYPIPMALKTPVRSLLGSGQVPRQYDLLHLLALESQQDEIVDPAGSQGRQEPNAGGVQGLKDALKLNAAPVETLTIEQKRAELASLTADLPDAIDPAMMTDADVDSALAFYRNR